MENIGSTSTRNTRTWRTDSLNSFPITYTEGSLCLKEPLPTAGGALRWVPRWPLNPWTVPAPETAALPHSKPGILLHYFTLTLGIPNHHLKRSELFGAELSSSQEPQRCQKRISRDPAHQDGHSLGPFYNRNCPWKVSPRFADIQAQPFQTGVPCSRGMWFYDCDSMMCILPSQGHLPQHGCADEARLITIALAMNFSPVSGTHNETSFWRFLMPRTRRKTLQSCSQQQLQQ